MPVLKPNMFAKPLRTATRCAGTFLSAVGAIVLFGWATDLAAVQSLVHGWPTMKANTAASFLLAGMSFLVWQLHADASTTTAKPLARAAIACAMAVTLIALITWCEYRFRWNAGLDQLLFHVPMPSDLAAPGRMSEATAVGFFLAGMALLMFAGKERWVAAAQTIGAVVFGLGALVLLAYVYGADLAKAGAFSTVAVHTAASFMVVGVGLLTLRGTQGWVKVFFQETTSAELGRRILLSAFVVLPAVAALRIVGQRNFDWYGTYFGIAVLVASSLAVLSVLIWVATRSGNAADWKLEKLLRINASLSSINTLIVRVSDKPSLFREACELAHDNGKFPWVWIATRKVGESEVRLQAQSGASAGLVQLLEMRLEELPKDGDKESWTARALRTQEPVVIHDLEAELKNRETSSATFVPVLLANRMRSCVLLPLVVAGESVGVMTFHAERPGFFDHAEMAVLRELAGDIAFAIQSISKNETLNYLSYYNVLTGLPNRTLFEDRLARELQTAARASQRVVLVIGDIKRFRAINETLGRTAGDELLRQIARRLSTAMKFPENLASLGGGTFASFMPDYDVADGNHIQSVLLGATREAYFISGQKLTLQTTIGAAIYPDDGADVETLLRNADTALREAKEHGDDCRFYKSEMNAQVAESLILENKLRNALVMDQFVLHYQPKVDFVQRAIHSVEALIRWNDPETGLVPPGKFIGLLEETGLIREVGDWALRRAVDDVLQWRAMGLQAPRCAVNVSAVQLREASFADSVQKVAETFGDIPCMLDLEITESLLMENVEQTTIALKQVLKNGVNISVDDFGTGFSSLAYLAKLPIHTLKIDRAFIIDLETDDHSRAIVRSIISLAHSLGLDVVAEGVETEAQATLLHDMGCDLMQGFLFSKGVPFEALAQMLPAQT
jgi:diguanylate cyclase (GGDEF)-like protein